MSDAPLALTMGEPAGIGAEIALKAWRALRHDGPAFFLIDDPARMTHLAAGSEHDVAVATIDDPSACSDAFAGALPVIPIGHAVAAVPGSPVVSNASAVTDAIRKAVALSMNGSASGVVTNPVQKSVLADAGFPHPGHTEFLAELSGPGTTSIMMLVGADLRVVPVTVHVPLATVSSSLTFGMIETAIRITHRALTTDFGIAAPRLAVAGLNPHAGEDGVLGQEENRTIRPAIDALRRDGLDIKGPLSADAMFHAVARRTYDAAICMYHDQALIPLKTLAFDEGVNVTLGLPFVRTSPDHGTALDIAGQDKASPASLIAALRLAESMVHNRRSHG
ncbi:MAG: 4-hydroxythreonine-4-phosphate dehydrogenase PdxA [Rhodospirillales bacterium]|nr:4-hydroxythreonine-4-phosphate dehydrogenase PdxA [Rhodospirillales bacterium]